MEQDKKAMYRMPCTTKEQSRILMGYGIPRESADLLFMDIDDGGCLAFERGDSPVSDEDEPAWSVGRLMEMLPHKLRSRVFRGRDHYLVVEKVGNRLWNVGYDNFYGNDRIAALMVTMKSDLTEALFELTCNLLLNDYELVNVTREGNVL